MTVRTLDPAIRRLAQHVANRQRLGVDARTVAHTLGHLDRDSARDLAYVLVEEHAVPDLWVDGLVHCIGLES